MSTLRQKQRALKNKNLKFIIMKEKTKIKAEVVADSVDSRGNRLTSMLVVMPRIIIAEINTHRMLSKNTSSSRAIPFNKMVEAVQNDPFIPIAWQKEHKGMQGSEYFTNPDDIKRLKEEWLIAKEEAINSAMSLDRLGVTKQLCNRLLEPFMWTTMLITGSKEGWDNFFELRCPSYEIELPISEDRAIDWELFKFKSKKDLKKKVYSDEIDNYTDLEWLEINKGQAEIHMMALAESIYDAMNESTPRKLIPGQWHIPFENKMDDRIIEELVAGIPKGITEILEAIKLREQAKVKISVAMAARTSYTIVGDEKEIDYRKMIDLHDRLIAQNPPHSSPLEHCARAMSDEEYFTFRKGDISLTRAPIGTSFYLDNDHTSGWCNNFKGFVQYRHIIEND